MEGKIFYYIDPMGPKNSIRGAYTAIKYVNMFATRYSSYNYNSGGSRGGSKGSMEPPFGFSCDKHCGKMYLTV